MVIEMKLDFTYEKPIYLQIAEDLEDDIIKGALQEETQIPSTNQLAVVFKINPATAAKGISILTEEGIVYKKRGIGMFVASGARKKIQKKRKGKFYQDYVVALFEEAKKIGITNQELIQMIIEGGKYFE